MAQPKLLVMSPLSAQALAQEWYMRGWRESGKNFHGQSPASKSKAVESLLRTEFKRQWARRHAKT